MSDAIRFYDRAVARLTRRQWLDAAWKLGSAAALLPAAPSRLLAQPLFKAYPFSLGVASGDPWPDGVVLWTRLAPEPLEGGGMPMANVEVEWEVAADPAFRAIARRGIAVARPELGHSVHVEAPGLEAGREYFYRFRCGRETSPLGRTRTAPAPGAPLDRLRFGLCGCSHYEHGHFTALRHLAEQRLDFVFHTGDYIYEGRADGGQFANRVRQHRGDELFTLVDYRNRYALYKLDPDLRAAHASAPFVVSWDDHEVDNDYAGDRDEGDTPPELFLLRRAAAYQAYYEAMPLRASALPAGPRLPLYRRLRFGDLVDLNVLDTRQYRSKQACGNGARSDCAEAALPTRSILGETQERWLFANLAEARARWTVLAQQVPTFPRDARSVNPEGRFSMDKWDGYLPSRQRLYARLQETAAANPVVLSGDVHTHWGADLKLDFQDAKSPTVGVELTNTSISAGGDGSEVALNWERIRGDNPHVKYHSARRGYVLLTATARELRAEFKVLDKVTVPGLPDRTGASLVVEAGRPGLVAG